MQVSYETSGQGLTGRYCCQRRHHTYGKPRCQQMVARFLDDHVVAQVLSALAAAAGTRGLACDRVRRQYQLAEPQNRLVARQLERPASTHASTTGNPAADSSAGAAARPGPRPPHRSGQPRARPMVAGHPGPRDRHADRHPVRMAQTRLDHRPARHPAPYRWIITADQAEVERLRALHQLPANYHNRRRWTDDGTPIDTSKDKEPDNHGTGDLRSSH
jgi:hypothetical protein